MFPWGKKFVAVTNVYLVRVSFPTRKIPVSQLTIYSCYHSVNREVGGSSPPEGVVLFLQACLLVVWCLLAFFCYKMVVCAWAVLHKREKITMNVYIVRLSKIQ